jgi:hypothetical protein
MPASASVAQEIGPPPEPQVGTGGEFIPIESSNIQAAGYVADSGTMTLLFDSGDHASGTLGGVCGRPAAPGERGG